MHRHRPSTRATDLDLAMRRAYAHGKSTRCGLSGGPNRTRIGQPGAQQQLRKPGLEIPQKRRAEGALSMCAVCHVCVVHGIGRAAACGVVLVPYDYPPSDFVYLAAILDIPYTCSLLTKSTAGSSGRHVEQEPALRRRVDTTNPLDSKSGLGQRDVTTYQIRSETTCHHAVLSIVTGRQRCEIRLPDKWWADRETSGRKESGVPAASIHDRASIPRLNSLLLDVFMMVLMLSGKCCESARRCCG